MVGRTLEHYRLDAKLGEGGMGVVYKAHDPHLNRPVAIKVLPPEKTADPAAKQRFVREAKAASALNHPGIVTIHDIRSDAATDFIVMEWIDGKTLAESIPSRGMRAAQALGYAVQIADALAAAHGAGILHRDIKPSNVMVTHDGRIKILDFGLAKLIEPPDTAVNAPTVTAPLTDARMVVGTAAYMSPEQAEGRTLDARSDIFSFGAMLYEMVTGQRPFRGDSWLALLARILNDDPKPPTALVAAIPPELDRVILRCLRKDPGRRYQTMTDLKVALEDVEEEESGSGKHGQEGQSRHRWVWASLVPVLLVAGVFVWRAWRAPESTEPLRSVPLTTLPGVQRYPSFAPDGNHVAFTWTGPQQDNPDIYVQQIGAGSPLRLTTDPGNDSNPVWAPDGRSIAFLRSQADVTQSDLRLVPPLGGPERKLAEIRVRGGTWVTPPYITWCPDSTCLVATDSPGDGKPDALFVISLESGEKRQLTHPEPPTAGDTNPAVSPDGRWLVFRRMATLYTGELYRLPLGKGVTAAGESQRLTLAALDAGYPTWMPDSNEILFSAKRSLWRLVVPGESKPARLPFVGEDGLMPVVSRPEPGRPLRLVYVRSIEDFNVWRVETSFAGASATAPPVASLSSTRYDGMAQLSPDGRRVAFSSDRSGEWEIWLADLGGSSAAPLTSMGAGTTGFPRWSPEGDRIVFHSNLEGQPEIYVITASGGKARNLTAHRAADSFPSFSRDGRWIYFSSNRTGEYRIWKIPASGGDVVPVANGVGYAPLESPDGAYIYYVQTLDAPSPLWRLPTSGGVPDRVLEGVVLANFVVLAGGIYYISRPAGEGGVHYLDQPSGETRLQYFDFATHASTTVARNLGNTVDLPLTASSDGRTILYSRMDSSVNDLMLVENFR